MLAGILKVIRSNLLPQGPPTAGCPQRPDNFWVSQGRRLQFSRKPIPLLSYCHSKEVFPDGLTEPPAFLFVPTTSLSVGHHWASLKGE